MHQHGLLYSLRGQRGNSIAVARSPVTRSVWRPPWRARCRAICLQRHRLVPRPTSIPRAMAFAGSCPSGAQAVREVDLLRAAQSGAMCGDNQLVRTAAADWSARCPAATPVPNHAAWQARRARVDRRLGAGWTTRAIAGYAARESARPRCRLAGLCAWWVSRRHPLALAVHHGSRL